MEEAAGDAVACHGPISQAQFLEGLGIRERLAALLGSASQDEARHLISGYERLVTAGEQQQETQVQGTQVGLHTVFLPSPQGRKLQNAGA